MTGASAWIYTLLVCAGFSSLILFLVPNSYKKIMETGCSCLMFLALISPFLRFDLKYEFQLEQFFEEAESQKMVFLQKSDDLYRDIIINKYKEYIIEEAIKHNVRIQSLNLQVMETKKGDWIVYEITYITDKTIPENFKQHITQQLGIPEDKQKEYRYGDVE